MFKEYAFFILTTIYIIFAGWFTIFCFATARYDCALVAGIPLIYLLVNYIGWAIMIIGEIKRT